MNGAVHGDAITTASTPERNPSACGLASVLPPPVHNPPNSTTTARQLHLDPPADRLAHRAQRQQNARERNERRDDADSEGEARRAQTRGVIVPRRSERKRLQR